MFMDPQRRMQMAQALAGGSDQYAPLRQAIFARRFMGGPEGQVTPADQVSQPAQGGQPQGFQGLLGQGGLQGGLFGILGRLLNRGQQPQSPAAPAAPFVRDMANVRTRQMAQALASQPVGAAPVSNAANVTGNSSPFRLFGIGM